MLPFTPGQCLFCPSSSPNFTDSVTHMQKSHGLFVPNQQHLVVDLETLFEYLHLVIFGCQECIYCGTERATVQAVQQHMTGKGHCKFDISEEDSELADFYDFSEPEDDARSDIEGVCDGNNREGTTNSTQKLLLADHDSIRLPSGKIISRQSSAAQTGPSTTQLRRRARAPALQLEYSHQSSPDGDEESSSKEEDLDSNTHDTCSLTKREKRERAMVTYQLSNMSASDRSSLVHLPASQRCAILAMQHRHAAKVQKEESRRHGRIDRKENKNLYAYWHTETPVYQCG